jgi:hypothetical protein
MNVGAWNEDHDGLTMMVEAMVIVAVSLLPQSDGNDAGGGGTVDVRVTVTCIVLLSLAAGRDASTEVPKPGWLDCSDGSGGLLALESMTRAVGFDGIIGGAEELGELLADAPGALGGDNPGQFRSIRG